MSDNKSVEEKLFEIVGTVFKKDPKELSVTTSLRKDLQAKSINFIEIAAMMESSFQKEFRIHKVIQAQTIGDLLAMSKDTA